MTNEFKQECKNSTYKNRLGRIETEDETISNFDNLASIEIVDSCISNGNILGNTNSKTITVNTLKNYNLIDRQINPFIGVKYDDTSEEYIKMGKYTITDETDDKTAQNGVYNGSDDLKKLDQVYVCGIEFTADTVITVLDFYKDVCRQLGLTPKKLDFINDDIPVSGNPFTNNETCRLVLQNIAQVFCTFVEIDWETNEIDLIWLDEEVTETFTKKDYSTLEKNQVSGPVNSLVIKESAIDGENVTREQTSKDIVSLEIEGKSEQETAPSIESSTEIKTVHGLQNLLELSSSTNHGITSKLNDDGSLNISGTTDTTWANITSTINKSILPGTYAFSVTKLYPFDITIRLTYLDDTYEDFYIAKGFLKKVVEISKQVSKYYVYISALSSGTSVDEDLYLQFEKGSVANEFVPYGNWLKVKNTGKNIIDFTKYFKQTFGENYSRSGLSFDVKNDGILNISGTTTSRVQMDILGGWLNTNLLIPLEVSEKYLFSTNFAYDSITISYKDKNDNIKRIYMQSATTKLIENAKGITQIAFDIGPGKEITSNMYAQLEKKSELTEYEPYKEISTLINMNKPNIIDKSKGTNINSNINSNYLSSYSGMKEYYTLVVECKPNTTYTVSRKVIDEAYAEFSLGSYPTFIEVGSFDNYINYSEDNISDGNIILNLKTGEEDKYLYIYYGSWMSFGSSDKYQELYDGLTIHENVITNDYFELSSINDTKDTLVIQDNKTIINKCIGKIILTGNEDWKIGNPNHRYYIDINNQCNLDYEAISTHFDCSKPIDYKKCLLLQNTDNNLLRVNIYNDDYVSDISNFKLWLKEQYDNGTPVTIYYVLKEPYNISLKGTYNIDLLDGINNITTNDLLQPNIKLTTDYVGNIEEYSGSQIQVQNDLQEINEISIIDNYFLYTEYLRTLAIDNIWNKIRGFTYTDCKLTSYTGKPYLKRGNKICVQDNDETYFDTYVLSHTFTYDGTFKSVVESPALSKSQTTMKNNQSVTSYFRKVERICNKIDGKLEDTIEQVNEDGEKISNVTQTVNEINTKIEDNKYYYDEKGNKILISEAVYQLQQTTNGAVSTISTTSGNNIFMNAIGLFGTDYWEGNCKSFTNTELQRQSGQRSCWLLQNTTQKQSVDLKNGNYTVSFIYKKIIPLADVKLKINGKSYDLTKTDFTNFSTTIEVSDNTLIIEFISDTDDSCYILNLMGNIGDIAQPFSNNPNETVTDTVMIGKGLEITSNTMNTKLKADADGVRVVNSYSDEVTSEFTDKGMSTNDLEAKGISKISGLLIMKVNRHIWITGVE